MRDDFYEVECRAVQKREIGTERIIEEQFFNSQGQLDRGNLPAVVTHGNKTGRPITQQWYRKGELHRSDGPASIHDIPGLKTVTREWWCNGQCHRSNDEPAIVSENYETGRIRREEFFAFGQKHRPRQKGPAVIKYCKDTGEVTERQYWENGERVRAPRRKNLPFPSGP